MMLNSHQKWFDCYCYLTHFFVRNLNSSFSIPAIPLPTPRRYAFHLTASVFWSYSNAILHSHVGHTTTGYTAICQQTRPRKNAEEWPNTFSVYKLNSKTSLSRKLEEENKQDTFSYGKKPSSKAKTTGLCPARVIDRCIDQSIPKETQAARTSPIRVFLGCQELFRDRFRGTHLQYRNLHCRDFHWRKFCWLN